MGVWSLDNDGAVAILTLARPPINTLDGPALAELADNLAVISADVSTKALVVTSGHERIFCAGGDLSYWQAITSGRMVREEGHRVFAQLAAFSIPTIAAINGHVVGDGLALALACDIRWASQAATFRLPELRYGFIPGWGALEQLVELIGRARATDLLLTGRAMNASEAERLGLVHAVVPREHLQDEVRSLSWVLASLPAATVRAAKQVLYGSDAAAAFNDVWGSADWAEGVKVFNEERAMTARGAER